MKDRAAVVHFRDKLYCIYVGSGDNREIWFASWAGDGNAWSWASSDMKSRSVAGPAAVVYRDRLYCIYQDDQNKGTLRCNSFDGKNWSGDRQIHGPTMSSSPTAVVWDDKIFCFFQGLGLNGELWYTRSSGGENWTKPEQLLPQTMTGSPTAIVVNHQMRIYYQERGNRGILWEAQFDEELSLHIGDLGRITRQRPVGPGMSYSPAVTVQNDKIQCLRHGSGIDHALWHVSLPITPLD